MSDICLAAARYAREGHPDLTLRQIAIFGLICDEPGQSVGPLARTLGLSKPVITRAKLVLTAMGLIESVPIKQDRRKISISPTGYGVELRQKLGSL